MIPLMPSLILLQMLNGILFAREGTLVMSANRRECGLFEISKGVLQTSTVFKHFW